MSTPPFDQIVTAHGAVVLRVCRALLGPADAGDAWSETFLAALRAYPDLRAGSNIRGWLVTIAHNKAIDQLRRRQRTAVPTEQEPERAGSGLGRTAGWTAERGGDGGAFGDGPALPDHELRAAVDALPHKQRLAVIYRYLADLDYAEVGELLDSSPAAARRSAADGIARLRTTYLEEAAR